MEGTSQGDRSPPEADGDRGRGREGSVPGISGLVRAQPGAQGALWQSLHRTGALCVSSEGEAVLSEAADCQTKARRNGFVVSDFISAFGVDAGGIVTTGKRASSCVRSPACGTAKSEEGSLTATSKAVRSYILSEHRALSQGTKVLSSRPRSRTGRTPAHED